MVQVKEEIAKAEADGKTKKAQDRGKLHCHERHGFSIESEAQRSQSPYLSLFYSSVEDLAQRLEMLKSTESSVKASEAVTRRFRCSKSSVLGVCQVELPPLKNGDKIRQLRKKLAELAQVKKAETHGV